MVSRTVVTTAAVMLAVVGVGAAAASDAQAARGYCSPSGDYCYAVKKREDVWPITFGTFSFRGRVKTCVTGPAEIEVCRRFRLRLDRERSIYRFAVRWSRHFPNEGAGRYRVRFFWQGSRLGPGVSFAR